MELKRKICYSCDLGLFLTGILLILLSTDGKATIEIRAIMGEIFILLSYFLFPFFDKQKKDKQIQVFSWHFLLFILSIFIAHLSLKVYINDRQGAKWWQEVLASIGCLSVISYYSYILISFIRSFYMLSSKLVSFLLSANTKEAYSNTKKIIEKITAFIVTITALAASLTALIASLKTIT